jgi:hypothetical protein
MAQEFYSINDVLRELQIEREQLEMMMQEGDIKAYREGEKIKFLKDDIDLLKVTKMDQPTIAVHKESEGEAILIEEIVEDGEEKEEETPVPLLSMSEDEVAKEAENVAKEADDTASKWENVMDANPLASALNEPPQSSKEEMEVRGETKSLIGLPEDAGTQPLLDIYQNPKKPDSGKSYEAIKTETEELVFERESEDMLETGELLFDSKEKVLPRDKEMEELFTESEMGISPLDSREENLKDAWDLAESGDEIASSATPSGRNGLAIDESKRRKKVRGMGTVAAGGLAFLVLAFFIMFPNRESDSVHVKVKLYQLQEMTFPRDYTKDGVLHSVKSAEVYVPDGGKISELAPVGTFVQTGTPVAYLTQRTGVAQQLKELEMQIEKCNTSLQIIAQHKSTLANFDNLRQVYAKSKRIANTTKKKEDVKKSQDDLQQLRNVYAKYQDMRKVYDKAIPTDAKLDKQIEILNTILKNREIEENQKIESTQRLIVDKTQKDFSARYPVPASQAGVVDKWSVAADEAVTAGQNVCSLALLQAEFLISEVEKRNWKEGDTLKIKHGEKELSATVEKIYADQDTKPVMFHIWALLNSAGQDFKQGTRLVLEYQKEYGSVVSVPLAAILEEAEGTTVLVVKEEAKEEGNTSKKSHKIYKRQIRVEKTTSDLALVSGDVAKGEYVICAIVYPKSKGLRELKNGQTVVIQND